MNEQVAKQTGWRPIPLPLKILAGVMVLWAIGSIANLSNLMENGLPMLGIFVFGIGAFLVVLFLDFIGPGVFLYALWNRKRWGAKWAFFYIGLFILNGFVALLLVRDTLGLMQILMPNFISMVFLAVIYWKRSYFDGGN